MSTLILAEHNQQTLSAASLSTLQAAKELPGDIHVLVVGENCRGAAEHAAKLAPVKKVLLVENARYKQQLAEIMAELVVSMAQTYTYILSPANTFGKNIMPRIAALLDVAQISDVITIQDNDTFVHPVYAGNVIETVKNHEKIKCLTIRSTAFGATEDTQAAVEIESVEKVLEFSQTRFVERSSPQQERPELTSARVVVSGGRGLQNQENFKLMEELADCLQGAVGASRAAVDAGFVPNDYQVGQTGKVVAPELYIAIGISGAIQHLAGMLDSKVIVAINKDPDAPIFKVADYGLVGDLFTLVPELIAVLKQRSA